MGSLGTVLGATSDLPKRKVPWAFPKDTFSWLTSTRDVQGFELCRLDLLGQSLHVGLLKVFTQQLFSRLEQCNVKPT